MADFFVNELGATAFNPYKNMMVPRGDILYRYSPYSPYEMKVIYRGNVTEVVHFE